MKHYRFTEEILVRMNEEVKYFIINRHLQPTVRSCSEWSKTSPYIEQISKSTVHVDMAYRFKYFVDLFPYLFEPLTNESESKAIDKGYTKHDISQFYKLNSHLLDKVKTRGPIKLANIYMLTEENYNIIRDIMVENKGECTLRGGLSTKRMFLRKRLDKLETECC